MSRPIIPALQSAATALGLPLGVARLQGPGEFDRAFQSMAGSSIDASDALASEVTTGWDRGRGLERRLTV